MQKQTDFRYNQETLFAEFQVAKDKDIKLSKKKSEHDVHKNRVQFFKDHIELRKINPEVYEHLDVNFDNLLIAYQSPNPRDHFYMKVFGKTYGQKMAEQEAEDISVNDKE